ncbi:MAG: hypothetical protein ABIQ73_03410 [Acidimicrobiales bacterium]
MAALAQGRDDVIVVAHPTMERLRELSGESVGFHWLVGDRRVCVHELVSDHPLRMASGVGNWYPLVSGAGGKAILANVSEARLESILAKAEGADPTVVRGELARARALGYATSHADGRGGARDHAPVGPYGASPRGRFPLKTTFRKVDTTLTM